jgi:hypothetical protein
MSEGTPVANETEVLALVVLRAANRTQAKGTSVRLVVLRAPEVANEVDMGLTEAQLLSVEGYLAYHGYIEPVHIGLSSGTYTITTTGLEWVEMSAPEPLEPASEGAKPRPAAGGAREDTREDIEKRQEGRIPRRIQRGLNEARKQLKEERPWWRRVFGGCAALLVCAAWY